MQHIPYLPYYCAGRHRDVRIYIYIHTHAHTKANQSDWELSTNTNRDQRHSASLPDILYADQNWVGWGWERLIYADQNGAGGSLCMQIRIGGGGGGGGGRERLIYADQNGGGGGGGGGRKAHTGIIHFRMGTDESIRMVHIRMGAETYRHNSNQNREGWKYFK